MNRLWASFSKQNDKMRAKFIKIEEKGLVLEKTFDADIIYTITATRKICLNYNIKTKGYWEKEKFSNVTYFAIIVFIPFRNIFNITFQTNIMRICLQSRQGFKQSSRIWYDFIHWLINYLLSSSNTMKACFIYFDSTNHSAHNFEICRKNCHSINKWAVIHAFWQKEALFKKTSSSSWEIKSAWINTCLSKCGLKQILHWNLRNQMKIWSFSFC